MGQLGNGTTAKALAPVTVTGLADGAAVACGFDYSCALRSDGSVACWGNDDYGQLGNAPGAGAELCDTDFHCSTRPVPVPGLGRTTAIAATADDGSEHSCALLSDGTIECWAANTGGELGSGTPSSASSPPVTVTGLRGATAVAVASAYTCAVAGDGTVDCWGQDVTLGIGAPMSNCFGTPCASVPAPVVGLAGAIAIAAGSVFRCALLFDGTVRCWGQNDLGELGNGSGTSVSTPTVVSGLAGAAAVTTSRRHACALLRTGTVKCWGANSSGQLGDGTRTDSSSPVDVVGLAGVSTVAAGADFTCAGLADGSIRCWGSNASGELGDGTGRDSPVPVVVSL
jgi:alpha-tubulin suppressor-like RCC1 family protein